VTKSYDPQSLVLASDYRVPDPQRMWARMQERRDDLASLGAHHVVVYSSAQEPGRVLVTIGVRHKEPVTRLMRSPAIREWFDLAGVDDIPAVFAGEIVEKIDVNRPSHDLPPGIVVAALTQVHDVAAVGEDVHRGLARFGSAGVRKIWIYRALDDMREVLILQEIDSTENAQRWIEHPDAAAEWMRGTGFGPYPPLFVGTLMNMLTIGSNT
jgi:hypothetical protein